MLTKGLLRRQFSRNRNSNPSRIIDAVNWLSLEDQAIQVRSIVPITGINGADSLELNIAWHIGKWIGHVFALLCNTKYLAVFQPFHRVTKQSRKKNWLGEVYCHRNHNTQGMLYNIVYVVPISLDFCLTPYSRTFHFNWPLRQVTQFAMPRVTQIYTTSLWDSVLSKTLVWIGTLSVKSTDKQGHMTTQGLICSATPQ